MSWFDTTGFANLAKSALKEAQKTIDKALDIKNEEQSENQITPVPSQEEDADFFNSWGIKSSNELTKSPNEKEDEEKDSEPTISNKNALTTSLWGSFTGSFFDNPKTEDQLKEMENDPVSSQPKKSLLFQATTTIQESRRNSKTSAESKSSWDQEFFHSPENEEIALCDTSSDLGVEEGFSRSKLVVESEDGDGESCSRLSSNEDEIENTTDTNAFISSEITRRRESSYSNFKNNRLSIISSESDKKSSESVEIIGHGSGFTTSPESPMSPETHLMNLKANTFASSPESVEVISEAQSSVEILPEEFSGRSSRTTTVSCSPYTSPMDPINANTLLSDFDRLIKNNENVIIDKVSPESVEVIRDDEDEEDMSVADDSYTSASESTATNTNTVIEISSPFDSCKSPHHVSAIKTDVTDFKSRQSLLMDSTFGESLKTSLKEEPALTHNRSSLQLCLNTNECSKLPDKHEEKIEKENKKIDKFEENILLKPIPTDSSCEGTIMESSSDDTIITSGDLVNEENKSATSAATTSYYVKTLLADAIGDESKTEIQEVPREHSPISSESRSDMVKVGSEQTSGHTSGDELETTTSSDIEIISSPNGDSSSTQSRHSPAKLQRTGRGKLLLAVERADSPNSDVLEKTGVIKFKGHKREPSEASSGGSDDSHSEVEKCMKRIREMTEILEVRESKLIELSHRNIELQENNTELKSQLDTTLHSRAAETQDINQITEEFTQRLSSLEKKFQQSIREKESLRKQLDQSKAEAASRLSLSEMEPMIKEKDEIIKELREEGEKLSKQQLHHSTIIKKLRSKEKDSDSLIKNKSDQLEELSREVERLKRSLTAKEDVELSQIEAVHQLTAKNKKIEKELNISHKQLEEANKKMETLKNSLETKEKELSDKKKEIVSKERELQSATQNAELTAKQELLAALERAKSNAEEEKEMHNIQLDDLRIRLRQAEEEHSTRESHLKKECSDLLRRIEEAETRNEKLSNSVSSATRPLIKQLESLQTTTNAQKASWEKQERNLSNTLADAQAKMSILIEQERSSREHSHNLRSQNTALEAKISVQRQETEKLKDELSPLKIDYDALNKNNQKLLKDLELERNHFEENIQQMKREMVTLEQQLAIERSATEAEKRKTSLLQEQLKDREGSDRADRRSNTASPRSSPTLSFGRVSLSESIASNIWPQFQDDAFECTSTSGRYGNVYESLRSGNTTTLLEGLQSQLKLRDGEVQQLQWELSRRDNERTILTHELSQLTTKVEDQEVKLKELEQLKSQFEDLQTKYNALLQMYGEKVEETQELQLDLQDVKEMYKTQIDQLLKKESSN